MVKSTYSLDAASLERLSRLSRRWQVSKTEAIRRALVTAEQANPEPTPAERLSALSSLQKSLKERRVDFDAWEKAIRDGRR